MGDDLTCWKCGVSLEGIILPLSRREECDACGADQHVCMLCQHYDPHISGACAQDRAEDVSNKEQANFCDYFKPQPGAFKNTGASMDEDIHRQLADLFGDTPVKVEPQTLSIADAASAELENLFSGSKVGNDNVSEDKK